MARRVSYTCAMLVLVTAALATAVLAACATGGAPRSSASPAAGDAAVVVEIVNDLSPPTSAWVTISPGLRPLEILGTVHADQARSFQFDTQAAPHHYRLVAELQSRRFVVSRPIQVLSHARVRWKLNQNLVTIERTK